MPEISPPYRAPLLCRIGLHTSTFRDGCMCHSADRCNKCLAWIDSIAGAYVDNCRAMVTAGTHPQVPGPCFLSDANAPRDAQ